MQKNSGFDKLIIKKKLQLQNVFPLPEKNKKYFLKLWVDDLKCVLFCFVCLLEKYQPKTNKNYLAPYSPVFIQITVVF